MPLGPTQRPEGTAFLVFRHGRSKANGTPFVNVYYTDVPESERVRGYKKARIAKISKHKLRIYPLTTIPQHHNYLQQRYDSLKVIQVRSKDPIDLPSTQDEFEAIMAQLKPEGIGSYFEYGLTFLREYRLIPEVIGDFGVHTLEIVNDGTGSEEVSIKDGKMHLSNDLYDRVRRRLNRITDHHRDNGIDEKLQYLEDILIKNVSPSEYKAPPPKLRKGQLASLTAHGAVTAQNLTKRDQQALVQTMQNNVATIVQNAPEKALQLRSNIELVTLKELIAKFEKYLRESHNEPFWQTFFKENPFILSLAFATPVVQVHDNAYVGGQRFTGDGGKFADYLYKTGSTGNLCIVEIKKPSSKILKSSAYRPNLYQASSELTGAVTQVMHQRMELNHSIHMLTGQSRRHDLKAHSVQCVVIAGVDIEDEDQKMSFELYRTSLNSVTVITFNELLSRLKEIDRVLSEEQETNIQPTAPADFSDTPDEDDD